MRTSIAKLYAPFLAIALVQALLVAVAPSKAPEQGALTGDFQEGGGSQTQTFGNGEGSPVGGSDPDDTGTASSTGGTGGSGGSAGTGGSGGSGGSGQGAAGQPSGDSPYGFVLWEGDTSHCTPDGKQHDIVFNAPPCFPKWPEGWDNGGATYQGVTADTIKIVYFSSEANPLVNQILATQGLAQTEEQAREMHDAAVNFLNQYYEFYGREIEYKAVTGDCPQTPPDPDACRAAAREVINAEKPFMVIWGTPLYPTVFDEFVRAGILTLGGWHFDESQFTKRRPLRYDVFMDGTRSANLIAEYYCKKLSGKNVSHSGALVHRSIGARGQVQRKLGIVVPKTETNIATAETVRAKVRECDGQDSPIFTYESNIETAQQQSTATTAALIDAGVTTVTCMCDPIAPRFATQEATNQQYFPEWLMPGLGLLDYDLVGRLYDQEQWRHAFGPSHLANPVPAGEEDASKVFRAGGGEGNACGSCGVQTAYWLLAGAMIQMSGPNLHPVAIENNIVKAGYVNGGWERTGNDPTLTMTKFAAGDYTALEDAREVIWRPGRSSRVDGRPGAYEPLNGGRRYENGSWPAAFDVPAPTGG